MHVDSPNPYAANSMDTPAAFAADSERVTFIRRTYTHLSGAVFALIGLEAILFKVVPEQTIVGFLQTVGSGWGPLVFLGTFLAASWIARGWAANSTSRAVQYAGLGLYVVVWAVYLLPTLYYCIAILQEPNLPITAAAITSMTFMGLTAFVFMTGADLAGWGKYLFILGLAALGVIVAGMLFGFSLGLWFSGAMVALMCAYILYDTSNVMHHYHTSQYVAAALTLFADVVLLFLYVLDILMRFSSSD